MESTREYQNERFQTLNQYTEGMGIVHGLEVESVATTSDGLEVTVDSGLALDGRGRPIVVEKATTRTLPAASADELYLFIQYDEVPIEMVPVPDTDGAVEEDAVPNRLAETFELTHRETAPERNRSGGAFDYSELDLDTNDPQELMGELADQYHKKRRTGATGERDSAVYLGGYERSHDGSWIEASDAPRRQYVYDHQMLYDLVVHHLADTDNPHETPIHEPVDPQPDDIETLNQRMDAIEGTISELRAERDTFVQYTLRKTVKDRARFFAELSDRVEKFSGDASRIARETAQMSSDEIIEESDMEAAYRRQLIEILEHLIRIGDLLEGYVTDESLERYLFAVSKLQSAVESDIELLDLIEADNQMCETADSLDPLVGVTPDA
ncbi:hypothetical protein [Halomicrobium katesii]|uniref:hypothetical protein n=1 Tax=Halomicrobium katesii TaxID=437163 RepID=UPI0003724C7B|nr:hypothetical protein [Halomicrobium katesii]